MDLENAKHIPLEESNLLIEENGKLTILEGVSFVSYKSEFVGEIPNKEPLTINPSSKGWLINEIVAEVIVNPKAFSRWFRFKCTTGRIYDDICLLLNRWFPNSRKK